MRKIILTVLVVIILTGCLFAFSGCKMEIEATDNSVSASVDGDTTERVDGILDWIKARIQRLFNGEEVTTNSTTNTAPTKVSPSSQA
jgi:hypothetical protein